MHWRTVGEYDAPHMHNHSPKQDQTVAPGAPGTEPTWSPAAKSGVGTALCGNSRLWFTLGRGIVSEVYQPTIDKAAIRDLEFLVTDTQGFFSEEKCDCAIDVRMIAPGVAAYDVENRCTRGRYRISKRIFSGPDREVLLQRVKFVPVKGSLEDFHLYVLLSPRLGDQGKGNSGWVESYKNWPMLFARREDHSLALGSTAPWLARSVGYVGASDAWQDIHKHGRMTWHYDRADNGHIALAGEIDLKACDGEFILALSLDRTPEFAALNGVLSLTESFDEGLQEYIKRWQSRQKELKALDNKEPLVSANSRERERPDRSRPHVTEGSKTNSANLYRTSMMVLQTHRAKQLSGAGVASLAVPWGEVRGDDDLGGYHLVWARDLVEEAEGLLAGGAFEEVRQTLNYLRATQNRGGGWPQDMWLDGSAFSGGVQLDEAALPILLLNLAHREGAIDDEQMESYWPMVREAAAFVIRSGPATGQDRWENTPGLSPYTLATEIGGILVAARLADKFGESEMGRYLRQTADLWNDLIDRWTYVTDTVLARRIGVEGYYVRIAPSPGMHTLLRRGESPRMNQAHDLHVDEVVSPDALALVRFGLRDANDPRMINTVKVIDAMTRVNLPAGPCWHRYNGDYYGEDNDGAAFNPHRGKHGHGRAWPLLTGERGHYELARGDEWQAKKMLETMGGFASQAGFLPEQVWDSADIPERDLHRGRPSGSAMPLAWTHSEYVRLLRSIRDGRVFDRPEDSWKRYVRGAQGTELSLWRFDHKPDSFVAGRNVRVEVMSPALVHFTMDGWQTTHNMPTRESGLGFHYADLPTDRMQPGSSLRFTFRWPEAGDRWEGTNFELEAEPAVERARVRVKVVPPKRSGRPSRVESRA